jgi:tetratricopeptide (TPR) repeat protein
VAENDSQNTAHDETIIPVKPGLTRVEAVSTTTVKAGTRSRALVGVGLALTLIVAMVVVFWLPDWVANNEELADESLAEPVAEEIEEPVGPTLSEEELEALRTEAEALLADLLTQQAELGELSAASWGDQTWLDYEARARAGDDAYLANSFQDAVPAYAEALELGTELLRQSGELIAAAISAGNAAIDAGNARLATEQFELVLGIRADHEEAGAGLARAQTLPQVLVLVQQGEQLERDGQLDDAAAAFREAVSLDALWEPARIALSEVSARIENRDFDALMSRGLAALASEDFATATEVFLTALALRPGSTEAQNGLIQAEQGAELDRIALAEARGLAAETVERWDRAIQIYRDLLSEDPSLGFAQAGLERSQLRADLEAKLVNLIDNPALLFSDQVLSDAGALLDEARAVEGAGARLGEQIAELERIVLLASTPLTVELRSDELTNVTLYRVGPLGTFSATQVELRPGNYRAQGTRNGYRDVLVDIIVRPGRTIPPVDVRCVEPI